MSPVEVYDSPSTSLSTILALVPWSTAPLLEPLLLGSKSPPISVTSTLVIVPSSTTIVTTSSTFNPEIVSLKSSLNVNVKVTVSPFSVNVYLLIPPISGAPPFWFEPPAVGISLGTLVSDELSPSGFSGALPWFILGAPCSEPVVSPSGFSGALPWLESLGISLGTPLLSPSGFSGGVLLESCPFISLGALPLELFISGGVIFESEPFILGGVPPFWSIGFESSSDNSPNAKVIDLTSIDVILPVYVPSSLLVLLQATRLKDKNIIERMHINFFMFLSSLHLYSKRWT